MLHGGKSHFVKNSHAEPHVALYQMQYHKVARLLLYIRFKYFRLLVSTKFPEINF